MELISVIVPVYNVEPYIEECVKSICSQTYSNLEIILIDDGSKDGSSEKCDILAESDARIRVLHKKNGGVSRARNDGLNLAQGDYITFVDGDDWLEPDMYKSMIEMMREDIDIVFCRFVREYQDKSVLYYEKVLEELVERPYDLGYIIYEYEYKKKGSWIFTDTVFGSVCRSIFRKNLIDRGEIEFAKEIEIAEDRLFLMRYLAECNKAALVDKYCYHYRSERVQSATYKKLSGYQKDLFERKKQMLNQEFEIIRNITLLPETIRADLVTYEKYRFAFEITMNEILFNKRPWKRLRILFKDDFLNRAISGKAFKHMKRQGGNNKRVILYLLIRLRLWRVLYIILMTRKRGK